MREVFQQHLESEQHPIDAKNSEIGRWLNLREGELPGDIHGIFLSRKKQTRERAFSGLLRHLRYAPSGFIPQNCLASFSATILRHLKY